MRTKPELLTGLKSVLAGSPYGVRMKISVALLALLAVSTIAAWLLLQLLALD